MLAKNLKFTDAIKSRGLEPLKEIINNMGGWPVVEGDSWDKKLIYWFDLIKFANDMGLFIKFPVDFDATFNQENTTLVKLQVYSFR